MNRTTRRHPRTLVEAFGPYTTPTIDVPHRTIPACDWALYAVAGIAVVVLWWVL